MPSDSLSAVCKHLLEDSAQAQAQAQAESKVAGRQRVSSERTTRGRCTVTVLGVAQRERRHAEQVWLWGLVRSATVEEQEAAESCRWDVLKTTAKRYRRMDRWNDDVLQTQGREGCPRLER